MKTFRQVNIKNRQNDFFNDMTKVKNFGPSLNIVQVSFENNDSVIYDIKYIKNLDSSNCLFVVFNNLDAYIKKSGENKYLIFASTEKNGKVLANYTELWHDIKEKIEFISGNKVIKYEKDFMRINLNQMMTYHWVKY